MTALEIRLIAYALGALFLLGGSGFIGYRITANRYEALIARDRAAQDRALQDAQQTVIAAQADQAQATQKAETQYADLKSSYDALSNDLARSVQQYTQIHRGIVSATRSPTALADAARESTGRTEELGSLVREAAAACAGDAAELTALQTWASSLSR